MTKESLQSDQIGSKSKPENFQIEEPGYENGNTSVKAPLPSCNPLVPHSLLFGYSNDLDYDYVLEAKRDLLGKLENYKPNIIKLANIRFDVKIPENVDFHDDYESFNASISSRMPDSNLSFPSITQSSDAMSAVKSFFTAGKAPLCGAIVYILTKRISMDTDTLSGYFIINHAKFYILQADAEFGSLYNSTLLDPMDFSRGLNVYVGNKNQLTYALRTMNVLFFQYNVYYTTIGIGGRERSTLIKWNEGHFTTPYLKNRNGLLFFTVQCSGPLENFQYINVTILDTVRNTEQFAYVTKSDLIPYNSNVWFQYVGLDSYTKYEVFADFGDYGRYRDCINIRVNSLSPVNYWFDGPWESSK